MEYQYMVIALLLMNVFFAHVVAEQIGRKRRIGYGKSVFWSILFSPIIGFFITVASPKRFK